VIVGSAIVRRIGDHQQDAKMAEQVGRFVHALKAALPRRAVA
jgi:tryptophan synthase alpha subunit